jgi:hypothetical protein
MTTINVSSSRVVILVVVVVVAAAAEINVYLLVIKDYAT